MGHGDLEDQQVPKLIDALAGIKVVKIACGSWHSAALTADGDLYTWGWNSNGQLGIKTTDDDPVQIMAMPQLIDFEKNVTHVACGSRHTICLLSNKINLTL